MAVTVEQLALELRVIPASDATIPAGPRESLARLLAFATAHAETLVPGTPEVILDQAVIMYAGYLWDRPLSPQNAGYANAWRNSGAASVTERYRERRAAPIGGEALPAVAPRPAGPGGLVAAVAGFRYAAIRADANFTAADFLAGSRSEDEDVWRSPGGGRSILGIAFPAVIMDYFWLSTGGNLNNRRSWLPAYDGPAPPEINIDGQASRYLVQSAPRRNQATDVWYGFNFGG